MIVPRSRNSEVPLCRLIISHGGQEALPTLGPDLVFCTGSGGGGPQGSNLWVQSDVGQGPGASYEANFIT